MIKSDWHIHSEASYDATLPVGELVQAAQRQGLEEFGITDHANFNTVSFWENLRESARLHTLFDRPGFYLGVELTPISRQLYAYCEKHGTDEGFVQTDAPDSREIALMITLDEMRALGMRYSVAAAHWPLNAPDEQQAIIREWHRQQMWLVCDERVDVLAHPWWYAGGAWRDAQGRYPDKPWFGDFDVVPSSMHDELAQAMLAHNVAVEVNYSMVCGRDYNEAFYPKYIEFLRYLFERGVKLTYGSDWHGPDYPDLRVDVLSAMAPYGFKAADFTRPMIHDLI